MDPSFALIYWIGRYVVAGSKINARKRARWQGRANVERFAKQLEDGHSAQRFKDDIETDIVRRAMRGEQILDVGIGTGRVSLPLVQSGLHLTGIDSSAAMIQYCARDPRSATVRLVKGDLDELPFAGEAFDTVMSVDTVMHYADWVPNLDELLRVTRVGGRVIVDVGSRDHIESVARNRGCTPELVQATELASPDDYVLRLSCAELRQYAAERGVSLVALIPYGAILGSLVPNYWIHDSYAFRSGGTDRLLSWINADPLLVAFAHFIERRIVQQLSPAVSGRMYAVFERSAGGPAYREPLDAEIALGDERGAQTWHAEFCAHAAHEPNRAFAVAFLLAARPIRLTAELRAVFPEELLRELDRTEHAASIDDICDEVVAAWRSVAKGVTFHGVDLSDAFGSLLRGELRERLEANE